MQNICKIFNYSLNHLSLKLIFKDLLSSSNFKVNKVLNYLCKDNHLKLYMYINHKTFDTKKYIIKLTFIYYI